MKMFYSNFTHKKMVHHTWGILIQKFFHTLVKFGLNIVFINCENPMTSTPIPPRNNFHLFLKLSHRYLTRKMYVCLKLKISVTAKPIGIYSSGNISTDPVVFLSYFLSDWNTFNPPKKKKSHLQKNFFL